MFDHFALGTRVNPSGPDDVDVSPESNPEPIPDTSPSILPCTPSNTADPDPPALLNTVDSLAYKLSEQHLRIDDTHMLSLPPIAFPSTPLDVPIVPPCPELEMDGHSSSLLPDWRGPSSLSSCSLPSVIEDASLQPQADSKRVQRQLATQFHNNPLNTKTIETMVNDMISTGEQCNIYQPPPMTPTIIEADDELNLMTLQLEVDENEKYDTSWMDNLSLRRASGPGGIRKHGPLHYRLSADVAMSSPNAIRSRPRMRRRKKLSQPDSSRPSSRRPSSPTIPSSHAVLSPAISLG